MPLGAGSVVAEELWDQLRGAGLRLTPIRRDLVALFASIGRWLTPQELYEEAERAGLRPGLATIYRLVDALTAAGLCRAYPQPNRTVRYVFCQPNHHHHMICRGCGRVLELTECRIAPPDLPPGADEHAVDFFGLCEACSAGSASGPAAAPRDQAPGAAVGRRQDRGAEEVRLQ